MFVLRLYFPLVFNGFAVKTCSKDNSVKRTSRISTMMVSVIMIMFAAFTLISSNVGRIIIHHCFPGRIPNNHKSAGRLTIAFPLRGFSALFFKSYIFTNDTFKVVFSRHSGIDIVCLTFQQCLLPYFLMAFCLVQL